MKRVQFVAIVFLLTALVAACAAPAAAPAPAAPAAQEAATSAPAEAGGKELTFVTVVKIAGINWFNRMEEGVKKFGADYGVNASLVGPAQADAAQQIPIIEDLIAQGVDALCVIPMDPIQLDPVLKKAMDAGIVVITHEASNQTNMHWDIEAFDNKAFGAGLMDRLAALMGEEGEYAVFVGSLGSKTHNEWVDGGIERQREAYPNMKLVGDKNETFDDSEIAYQKAKEILAAYPNIKGFQGSASTDVAGIGRAIEEAGLQDEVAVVGTSLPSIAGDLLYTGAIDVIGFWDPAAAGYACNKLALMQINGEPIGEGTDLGIPGYESLKLVGKNVLYANAPVYVDAETAGEYPF
ncbi:MULTISPECIES: autoinducer 2 ABC transporter substrate-binding protein [Caldilinea]|uniref:Putative ABC transporter substrate binding protein n=1 Tax=Caldilinea aerophila (strain DSM 14535 / JCM 11387 / NBRC 104270 / STL-6-O1) TaxID=926550 RepID=I0I9G2_CALAS|nr:MULTISPECIES: autoinducer 2 ABC transporter substrate-binding protein [Caldilinea]BAM01900.1 putative ABC transporter substrate binding protein [Caldilinea aerophila DSM 14535 = NBRC 104270]GIV73239.1 MAG: autoinducer 2 ABC transporter substrate-binding protein [Caldilinea sp.]